MGGAATYTPVTTERYTSVNDRVQTILTATNVDAAVDAHADLIDNLVANASSVAQVNVTFGDFPAGSGAKVFAVLPPDGELDLLIEEVWYKLTNAFAGGSLSACTLQVGNEGDANAYILAQSVFTGGASGNQGFATAQLGVARVEATANPFIDYATSVIATFTPTGDNLENATAGDVTVYVKYRRITP